MQLSNRKKKENLQPQSTKICKLTNDIDAVFECDSICAFGLYRNRRPQLPAVCPRLPALDLIRRQLSIRPAANHKDPSVEARGSERADADC